MCEFHDSNGNGFRDIWWTDKLIYFSSMYIYIWDGLVRVNFTDAYSPQF